MTFIEGALSATAFWGIVYWLYVHNKLPGIEQRIKDFISAEVAKLKS